MQTILTTSITQAEGNVGGFFQLFYSLLYDNEERGLCECIIPSPPKIKKAYNGVHIIPPLPGSSERFFSIKDYNVNADDSLPNELDVDAQSFQVFPCETAKR